MWNIEKTYSVSLIISFITILVMFGLYLYGGIKFSLWWYSIPLLAPTAIFLLVVLCALIYSHILVKRSSDDSDAD